MSLQSENPVVEELPGGRQRVRGIVPGLRWVNRIETIEERPGGGSIGKKVKVLQQRWCVETIEYNGVVTSRAYEWVDVPTEQE